MSRHYRKRACPICGIPMSTAGAAWVSHGRMHVRRGEAVEIDDRIRGRIRFAKPERWEKGKDSFIWIEVRRSEAWLRYNNLPETFIRVTGIASYRKLEERAIQKRKANQVGTSQS